MATEADIGARPRLAPRRRSRDQVIRACAEIFARRGFRETSIRDIAEALGVTKSALYHHIRSKDELLVEIVSSYQAHGEELVAAARRAGPDPARSLATFVQELVLMNARDQVMATLLSRELRSLKQPHLDNMLAIRDGYEGFVHGLILSGQATGRFRASIDARLATIAVFALARSLHQWYRPDGRLSANEVAAGFESLILNGLLTEPATGTDAQTSSVVSRNQVRQ
ncbi:MAG: TetR/AcrR family transcriptional regulator [Burkholderiaceae bacterium]